MSRRRKPAELAPPGIQTGRFAGAEVIAELGEQLLRNDKGGLRICTFNARLLIACSPIGASVQFDEFANQVVVSGPLPSKYWPEENRVVFSEARAWTDVDDARLSVLLQDYFGFMCDHQVAGRALDLFARERPVHPVREYLDSLTWDGIDRLAYWLDDYLGVERSELTMAIGSRWLISAVARIYDPGCKVDAILILEGPQGSRKSSALECLAPDWFTDDVADLGSKDSAMQIAAKWIVELPELTSISRSDVDRVKAFASRRVDRFRPPYGERVVAQPRSCVFAGTTNRSAYLSDETGGRRFWPVKVGSIDLSRLAEARDQLWAEAVHRFRADEPWHLDDPKLVAAAADAVLERHEEDPWEEMIGDYIRGRASVSVSEVLSDAISLDKKLWEQKHRRRVGSTLTKLGWIRDQIRIEEGPEKGKRVWRYHPPDCHQTRTGD